MNKKEKLELFEKKDIYCITAENLSNGRKTLQVVEKMLESGIKIIQYREKKKSYLEMYRECIKIREMTKACNAVFIVNDHIGLAKMIEADGIHIGQDDYPVDAVRKILGDEYIIGLSTHSPEQMHRALKSDADYIGVGPIFPTQTKENVCDAVGLEYLEYAVKNSTIPFVAIGGIKEHNIDSVIQKGAKCICLVSEITGAENINTKIQNLRNKLGG